MDQNELIKQKSRVTCIAALINLFLAAIKVTFGILGQSTALIADGIHSLSDLASDVTATRSYYDSLRMHLANDLPGTSFSVRAELGLACAYLGLTEQAVDNGIWATESMPVSSCHW